MPSSILDRTASLALIVASAFVIGSTLWDWRGKRAVSPVKDIELELELPGRLKAGALADILLLEFSDFECPFCRQFHSQVLESIDEEFIRPGILSHIFVNFPVEQIHKSAFRAAEAAECAREFGRAGEMRKLLFANPTRLEQSHLIEYADSVGLDQTAFGECLKNGKGDEVKEDMGIASLAGVRGTPTFLIGRTLPSGAVRIVKRIDGAWPVEVFRTAIRSVQ